MSSSSEIRHVGKVIDTVPGAVTVEIVSESACSACHAKGLCGVSESKTKTVRVSVGMDESFNVGDPVSVVLSASMGHKAVWICYVIPLVVLVASLLAALRLGLGELGAGLAAMAAVSVYYFAVWLLRDRIEKEYIFKLISNND